MGRPSLETEVERLRQEAEHGARRFIDLRIRFELDDLDARDAGIEPEEVCALDVGGRWDRRSGDFDGEAESAVVVRFHPGQRAAVEWFAGWLEAHRERRDHPPAFDITELEDLVDTAPEHAYSALFAGGRRAGKTWKAVALLVAYAVAFPGSIIWLVAPNMNKVAELRRYLDEFLADEWIDSDTAAGIEICNGSQFLIKGAHGTGDGLKEGKANIVLLNEGQLMKERAFVVARGAIVDQSGLVLVCANPPVEARDERWVEDFAADARSGDRAAVYLHFNPLLNPHINRAALLALAREVDDRTYRIEVLGEFLPAKDAVAYNWIRLENEKPVPTALRDVTATFLAAIGEGEGILQVAGLDVQRFPYIGGPIYRFFGVPERDEVFMWAVGEVVLDGGDEEDWCAELEAQGYGAATTLIVCDGTAEYQHSRRRATDMTKPEWTGKGSFDVIRSCGYNRIVPPDRRMRRKNPAISDRLRAFTSLISTKAGKRRLFADPKLAPRTCSAIRKWKTVHGAPSRIQDEAHLGDASSYPVIRFFPRQLRPLKSRRGSPNPPDVNDLAAKIAAVDARPPSFGAPPPAGTYETPSLRDLRPGGAGRGGRRGRSW